MRVIKNLIFAFLISCACEANSTDIWSISSSYFQSGNYSTANAACRSANSAYQEKLIEIYQTGPFRQICRYKGGSSCWEAYNCSNDDGLRSLNGFNLVLDSGECEFTVNDRCLEICEDGLPEIIIDGVSDNCDRVTLTECPDGSTVTQGQICDSVLEPDPEYQCLDSLSCLAMHINNEPTCIDYRFEYISPESSQQIFECLRYQVIDNTDPENPVPDPNSGTPPDPYANPHKNPDYSGVTASDIAGAIQEALDADFATIERSINTQTENDKSQNTEIINALGSVETAIYGLSDQQGYIAPGVNGHIPSEGLAGFYSVEYPNGFSDVWNKNLQEFNDTSFAISLNDWKINVVGVRPLFEFCFDLGFSDYGCFDIGIPDYVFAFMKIVMLFTTAIFCRRIIFGG